jgi:inorganic pyrophosphatase
MTPAFVIENPKGSYKSFEVESVPGREDYPLAGVTYPVDYGYLEGYVGEDDDPLDVFVGSGELMGYIKVWRYDVPLETKIALNVSADEWQQILEVFAPVLKDYKLFDQIENLENFLEAYKNIDNKAN